MQRTYKILHRQWRAKRPLYWGMLPELLLVVALLVLFGLAHPDTMRTRFWKIGAAYKFNSNPTMLLYAYANHRPLPEVAFVWSQKLTEFNVAISIVSLFVLLGKMIAVIMKVYYPIVGLFVSMSLTALYAVSVYGQAGPDYMDERFPSPVAWYIRYSCSLAEPFGAVKHCMMAKGTFAVTVVMLALYLFQVGQAVWAMLPNPELDVEHEDSDDEEDRVEGKRMEMQPTTPRATPAVPFTPRTQAFHTLDRKLPLRQGYA